MTKKLPAKFTILNDLFRYTGMKLFCGLFMVVAIVGGIFIAFYAPHRPIFNICSTQFDWGSIARSIAKLEVGS